MKRNIFRRPLVSILGIIAMVAVIGLAGCKTDSDDDNGGGGGGAAKPAKLATTATYQQAIDKLDEIIAYPGAPVSVKSTAQSMKDSYTSNSAIESAWSSAGSSVIAQINPLIDLL